MFASSASQWVAQTAECWKRKRDVKKSKAARERELFERLNLDQITMRWRSTFLNLHMYTGKCQVLVKTCSGLRAVLCKRWLAHFVVPFSLSLTPLKDFMPWNVGHPEELVVVWMSGRTVRGCPEPLGSLWIWHMHWLETWAWKHILFSASAALQFRRHRRNWSIYCTSHPVFIHAMTCV